jgi:class 3 adenylate cyclase
MNTLNRLLGVCKDLKADVVMSAELLARMPRTTERFVVEAEKVVPVKGRTREVRVHVLQRTKKP